MSCVECYVRLKSTNKWELAYEVGNAWQGCMHLWNSLEKKYLPSYEAFDSDGRPDYLTSKCLEEKRYNHRSCYMMMMSEGEHNPMQEVCDLSSDTRLSFEEIMVMRSTMDNAIVLGCDIPMFIECLEKVAEEHGGNYKEQADGLRKVYDEFGDDISAIGWNQSSVNCADGIFGSDMDRPLEDFWDCMVTRECYESYKNESQSK